jgi:hypothetical protein
MRVAKVFTCEGKFAFMEAPQRFTFRVFADSSLSVDVEPLDPSSGDDVGDDSVSTGESTSLGDGEAEEDANGASDAFEDEDSTAVDVADDIDRQERPADDDAVAVEGDRADEEGAQQVSATKLFAFDGRALPGPPNSKPRGAGKHRECFIVHFKLVRWCRDPYSTQFIKVVGRLSSKHGLTGKCIDLENAMEEDAEGEDFKLRLVQPPAIGYRVETMDNPLFPLTPGLYVLNGHTIGENGYVYECQVRLKLKHDGMTVGTSRELLFPQECVLAGSWTRDHVNYLLQYHMHGNQCTYMYFGTPFVDGLRGSWQNADLTAFRSRAERGCLEFRLVEATRVWSAAYHKDYPVHFQECVKLMLLAAMRAAPGSPLALPGHLVVQIVSCFGFDWFKPPLLDTDDDMCDAEAYQEVAVE